MNKNNLSLILASVFIVLLSLSSSALQQYYSVSLKNSGGNTLFMGLNVLAGDSMSFLSSGEGYRATVLSYNSTPLFKLDFSMPEGTEKKVDLPYIKEAASIVITNLNTSRSLSINVIAYADLCGDNICEPKEDYSRCSADCPSGGFDGFCDGMHDGICDKDCIPESDLDCFGIATTTMPATTLQQTTTTFASVIPASPNDSAGIFQSPYPTLIISVLVIIAIIAIMFVFTLKVKDKSIHDYVNANISRGYDAAMIRQHLLKQGYDKQQVDAAIYSALKK